MPKDRPFIDSFALRGRAYIAPDATTIVNIQPYSRSLKELSKFDKESRSITCEIKKSQLRLDLNHVIGDKISISKKDAIKFASWILNSYKEKK